MLEAQHTEPPAAIANAIARDGAALVRGLLRPQVASLCAVFQAHAQAGVPMSQGVLYPRAPPETPRPGMQRLMNQWLNAHLREPPCSTWDVAALLQVFIAACLAQEDAVLFQDVLMDKRPGHVTFPWHQDFPFWPVDRPAGLIAWTALDPCDAQSGALQIALGSHRTGIGPAIDLHSGEAQAGYPPAVFQPADHERACPALAPGDVLLFHPLTWHCSPPNLSGASRRVWASTWLDGGVRWYPQRAPRHPLCGHITDGAELRRWRGR